MSLHGLSKLTLSLLTCLLLTVACGKGTGLRNSAAADAREDLVRAMKALSDARSYRLKTVTFTSGKALPVEGKSVMELEFSAPDRWHTIFESNLPPYNNQKIEWIIVGRESYTRVAEGPWQKGAQEMGALFRPTTEFERGTKGVEFIRNDALDGAQMLVYRHAFDITPDKEAEDFLTGYKGVAEIWVGVNDGLPHKIEKQIEAESRPVETVKARETTTYYDYNTDIRIELPK